MSGRHLIFVPEISPHTFVFFYEKGVTGRSYSIRDYSGNPPATLRYAKEFPYDATEILRMARRPGCYFFEAEVVPTERFDYWHDRVTRLNKAHLNVQQTVVVPRGAAVAAAAGTGSQQRPVFSVLNLQRLMKLPKARKSQDMDRILHSPDSEDYVTWNVFQLLLAKRSWWEDWLRLAASKNGHLVHLSASDAPEVLFWQTVPAPEAYEQASRRRMEGSENQAWIDRTNNPKPVEGESEIDTTLLGNKYLVFIEAKLASDISPRTTYDPDRNQIFRNIDCLLEDCLLERGLGRTPYFWMICRDIGPSRSYVQAIDKYRSTPTLLEAALPHRDPHILRDVMQRTAIFLWRELLDLVDVPSLGSEQKQVLEELRRRV